MYNMQQSDNPYDFSNNIGKFYQGYQQAFIPKQVQAEQNLNNLKQQSALQEMKYAPQLNEQKLQQLQLQNKGLESSNAMDAYKLQQAKMQAQREQNFLKMLMGGNGNNGNSPDQPSNQSAPNSGQMTGPAMMGVPSSQPAPSNMPNVSSGGINQTNNGTKMPMIDQLWNDPAMRAQYSDFFKKYNVAGKQQVFNNPNTGEAVVANTMPSGAVNFSVQKIGESPYQRSFESEKGRSEAGFYSDIAKQNYQLQSSNQNLDDIISYANDPAIKDIIGNRGQAGLTQYFASPENKQKLGDLRAKFGLVFKDNMQAMKGTGSISNYEDKIFQSFAPNEKDDANVLFGKAEALAVMNQYMTRKNQAFMDAVDSGKSQSEAMKIANQSINLQAVKPQIDDLSKGVYWMIDPNEPNRVQRKPASEVGMYVDNGWKVYG